MNVCRAIYRAILGTRVASIKTTAAKRGGEGRAEMTDLSPPGHVGSS